MDYEFIWTIAKWVGGIVGILLLLGGIALWYFWKKSAGKKYKFLLHSADGKNVNIIDGKVTTNPDNSSDSLFTFSNNPSKLTIRKPTKFIDGTAYREITYDSEGKYCYIESSFNDKKLENALQPDEKQITLFRLKETQERYKNPMEKFQAITLIAGFIMCLIVIGGVIFMTIKFSSQIGTIAEIAKDNKAVAEMNGQTMNKMVLVTEQLAVISGTKINNETGDLIRQLT